MYIVADALYASSYNVITKDDYNQVIGNSDPDEETAKEVDTKKLRKFNLPQFFCHLPLKRFKSSGVLRF